MPNWCNNVLTVKGSKKDIKEFVEKYCSDLTLDFDKVIPQPKTIEECPKKYIIHNEEEAKTRFLSYDENDERKWFDWYNWRCDCWGTKWTCNIIYFEQNECDITIEFDTAWAPPIPVIQKLIEDNKNMNIKCIYFEGGMFFGGKIDGIGNYEYADSKLKQFAIDNGFIDEDYFEEMED